jgi:hypothetical protein
LLHLLAAPSRVVAVKLARIDFSPPPGFELMWRLSTLMIREYLLTRSRNRPRSWYRPTTSMSIGNCL